MAPLVPRPRSPIAPVSRRIDRNIGAGVLVLLATLFTLVACDGGEAADLAQLEDALAGSQAVTFPNGDGQELAGRTFGPADAPVGVVLAHGLSANQSAWYAIADRLGAEGYRVLTFDFRGYCPGGDAGCSEGSKAIETTPGDVAAALDRLREGGQRRLAVIGSSMGGTAALVAAAGEGDDLAAVISLSAPAVIGGLAAGPDVLERVTAAKLFLAGTGDPTAAAAAEDFFNQSLQPKRFELLTTDDHGAQMFKGNQAEQTRTLVLGWLAAYLAEPTDRAAQDGA